MNTYVVQRNAFDRFDVQDAFVNERYLTSKMLAVLYTYTYACYTAMIAQLTVSSLWLYTEHDLYIAGQNGLR